MGCLPSKQAAQRPENISAPSATGVCAADARPQAAQAPVPPAGPPAVPQDTAGNASPAACVCPQVTAPPPAAEPRNVVPAASTEQAEAGGAMAGTGGGGACGGPPIPTQTKQISVEVTGPPPRKEPPPAPIAPKVSLQIGKEPAASAAAEPSS